MSFLFRPIRTVLLYGAAFLAGVFYERLSGQDACTRAGGTYALSGVCIVEATQ